jgi:hypothetical protein
MHILPATRALARATLALRARLRAICALSAAPCRAFTPAGAAPCRAFGPAVVLATLAAAALAAAPARAADEPANGAPKIAPISKTTRSHDMRLVGYSDLQARSAYQPTISHQGNRWIAYIGHHGGNADIPQPVNPMTGQTEYNGTSIVDVTDPRHPRYLKHIPGQPGLDEQGGAQMARICAGKELPKGDPAKFYLLRTNGGIGHQIWDVTTPENPVLLIDVVTGLKDTHKNWWECDTGIAYLVSDGRPDGWRTARMTKIYDLSDPLHPKFIRDFGIAGQEPGSTMDPVPQGVHGPMRAGNRMYFGYGTSRGGVIQVLDRDKLLKGDPNVPEAERFKPTPANLAYPQIGRLDQYPTVGAHTVFPLLNMAVPEFAKNSRLASRDFIVVTSESTANECREDRQMMYIVDQSDPAHPYSVSNFQVPEKEGNYCDIGGRFGTHSSHESYTPIYYGRLMFLAYFNAGIRAVDIREPWSPRQAAYYVPAINKNTAKRCVKVNAGGNEVDRCKIAIQTNNVEVDDRGYIYAVDRANSGMHILELTGAARKIANFSK